MEALVSAIITTHNRKALLQRAISSVFSQTYKNIELIVVDDASDVHLNDFCKDMDLRYIYISKAESKGGNYARNVGIKQSKGKYCAFLDDDDYWTAEYIEKLIALIEEKDCPMVYSGSKIEEIKNGNCSNRDFLPSLNGDLRRIILWSSICSTSAMIIKRSALFSIGLFDEELKHWQDYELIIRLAQTGEIWGVRQPLSVYFLDLDNKNRVSRKYKGWLKSLRYIHEKHSSLYSGLNFREKLRVKLFTYRHAAEKSLSEENKIYFLINKSKVVFYRGLLCFYNEF